MLTEPFIVARKEQREKAGAGPGLTPANFYKVSVNGFGDPYNCYPHAMTWFQDHLYVCTTRANLHYRGRWRAEKGERLGSIWPVKIPEGGLFDIDLRAQIWRYHPPSRVWSKVFVSPLITGIDGYEVPQSIGFRSITAFQGPQDEAPVLYLPTWGSHQTPESVMLRSTDGEHFSIVTEPGLGFPDPYQPRAVRGLFPFKGRLYAAPAVGRKRAEPNFSGYAVIMVCTDPIAGDWRLASEPGFGDRNNLSIFVLAAFNGYLYAGTANIVEGFQVWKTDAEGEPPFRWHKVLTHGAYRGRLNQGAISMMAFGDYLYVGSAIQEGGWDKSNNVGPAAPELLRIHKDDSWDLVMGETRQTPDGLKIPISGMSSGFGNPFAGYIWSLCTHDGWLYVGNSVWGLFLRYADFSLLPQRVKRLFDAQDVEKYTQRYGGFDLWRTRDGCQWYNVTANGLGNCYNYGVRTMVSTPHGLFLGATNPFGPEVAVKRAAGWCYEDNPHGGLEVWLGTNQPPEHISVSAQSSIRSVTASSDVFLDVPPSDVTEEERHLENVLERFFGNSKFRHFGFWHEGVTNPRQACENLMDELLAFLPEKTGSVLDFESGYGETSQYLSHFFPAHAVSGFVSDKATLARVRRTTPEVNFRVRPQGWFDSKQHSFEVIFWIKGLFSAPSTRKAFAMACAMLKPGGRMICLDNLSVTALIERKTGFWWKKSSSALITTEEHYREALAAEGLVDAVVTDVTESTVEGFKKYVTQQRVSWQIAGGEQNKTLKKLEQHLYFDQLPIKRSIIITAVKPPSAIFSTSQAG